MRELRSGDVTIQVRGSNLARLFYVQAFDEDFDAALQNELRPDKSYSDILETLYKIIWAMAKAENYAVHRSTLHYKQWRTSIGCFDITECVDAVMDEIEEGFAVKRVYKVKGGHTETANTPQRIIAVALKLGMSMRDLNELTTQAVLDIVHEFTEREESETRVGSAKEAAAYFSGGR
jgi:hypothetical protein